MTSILAAIFEAKEGRRFLPGGERSMWSRILRDLDGFVCLPPLHPNAERHAEHVRLVVEECTEPDPLKAVRAVFPITREVPDSYLLGEAPAPRYCDAVHESAVRLGLDRTHGDPPLRTYAQITKSNAPALAVLVRNCLDTDGEARRFDTDGKVKAMMRHAADRLELASTRLVQTLGCVTTDMDSETGAVLLRGANDEEVWRGGWVEDDAPYTLVWKETP